MAMASAVSTSLCSFSSSSTSSKLAISAASSSKIVHFRLCSWLSPLDRGLFSPWNGLKHLGISNKPRPLLHIDRKGRCKGKVVYASLFGVGAPEALVIGAVALLVFGPKGLAEVARNIGKALRSFQPTIRELQEVSREFKSTLEREIGLDDISSPTQNTYNNKASNTTSTPSSTASASSSQNAVDPNGAQDPSRAAYSSDEYLKITEEQLKAYSAQQQEQTPAPTEAQFEPDTQPSAKETATTGPPPEKAESETKPLDS